MLWLRQQSNDCYAEVSSTYTSPWWFCSRLPKKFPPTCENELSTNFVEISETKFSTYTSSWWFCSPLLNKLPPTCKNVASTNIVKAALLCYATEEVAQAMHHHDDFVFRPSTTSRRPPWNNNCEKTMFVSTARKLQTSIEDLRKGYVLRPGIWV